MRTSELIKRVMEIEGVNDYRQGEENLCFYSSKQGGIVAHANKIKKFELATYCDSFSELSSFAQELLLDLLYQYAITPPEEREEPKRYKLQHKLVEDAYLNYVKDRRKKLTFSKGIEFLEYARTIFTIQEWEMLTGQKWVDLLLQFKAIEV